ncbi:MAG: hypothetical protein AB7C96_05520 [Hydrogenovibrio sp.]
MRHPNLTHNGEVYDLSHFNPYTFDFELRTEEFKDAPVRIKVIFSVHCYAKKSVEGDPQELIRQDHRGEDRTFCPSRYKDSLTVRDEISKMVQEKVRHTGGTNFFYLPNGVELYFQVIKSKSDDADLLLRIQSMYTRTVGNPPNAGMIPFFKIVYQTMKGNKINTNR